MKEIARLGLVLFASLMAAPVQAAPSLVGDWYEDMMLHGGRVISIARLKADGTFRVDFRRCFAQGGPHDSSESGRWTYSKGVLRLSIEVDSGTPTFYTQEYRTDELTARTWNYYLVGDKSLPMFHDVRVTAGSKIPSCDLTS